MISRYLLHASPRWCALHKWIIPSSYAHMKTLPRSFSFFTNNFMRWYPDYHQVIPELSIPTRILHRELHRFRIINFRYSGWKFRAPRTLLRSSHVRRDRNHRSQFILTLRRTWFSLRRDILRKRWLLSSLERWVRSVARDACGGTAMILDVYEVSFTWCVVRRERRSQRRTLSRARCRNDFPEEPAAASGMASRAERQPGRSAHRAGGTRTEDGGWCRRTTRKRERGGC